MHSLTEHEIGPGQPVNEADKLINEWQARGIIEYHRRNPLYGRRNVMYGLVFTKVQLAMLHVVIFDAMEEALEEGRTHEARLLGELEDLIISQVLASADPNGHPTCDES